MTLLSYLITMLIGTAIAWTGWLLILFFVNPEEAPFWGIALFHLSLFFGLTGLLSVVGLGIRAIRRNNEIIARKVLVSFRQAAFFGILIITALILLKEGLFRWWSVGLLILLLTAIEFFFITVHDHKNTR